MLPDLYWSVIHLGPVPLQVWGLFVATGIGVALWLAKRLAEKQGLSGEVVLDSGFWIILGALIGARIFFVVTETQLFIGDWLGVFRVWDGGMSINGGFMGAVVAGMWYFKRKQVSAWRYLDVIVFALPLGEFIGRIGCFFIFDHPGSVTNFVLGEVFYGDGLVRHNHGLYLSLNGLVMFMTFLVLRAKLPKLVTQPPFFLTVFLLWYGVFRFIADFDRIADSHILGLTGGQWSAMLLVIAGGVLVWKRKAIVAVSQSASKSVGKPFDKA